MTALRLLRLPLTQKINKEIKFTTFYLNLISYIYNNNLNSIFCRIKENMGQWLFMAMPWQLRRRGRTRSSIFH